MYKTRRRYSEKRKIKSLVGCAVMYKDMPAANGYDRIKRFKGFTFSLERKDTLIYNVVRSIGKPNIFTDNFDKDTRTAYLMLSQFVDNGINFVKNFNLKNKTNYSFNSLIETISEEFLTVYSEDIEVVRERDKIYILYDGTKQEFYSLLENFLKTYKTW